MDFEEFITYFPKDEHSELFDSRRVISAIVQNHQFIKRSSLEPRVIVAIDEILKSKDAETSLHCACELMDVSRLRGARSIDIISTTLDPGVILLEKTTSNRPVVMVPLPALYSIKLIIPKSLHRLLALRVGGVYKYYGRLSTEPYIL